MQCLLWWKAAPSSWPWPWWEQRLSPQEPVEWWAAWAEGHCAEWLSKGIQLCPAGVCELLEMRRSKGCLWWLENSSDPQALAEAPTWAFWVR